MKILKQIIDDVIANPSSQNIKSVFFKAFFYFIGTAVIAGYLEWGIVDTAWSLWLTSFCVGIMAVFADTIYMFWFLDPKNHTPEQKASPTYNPNSPGARFTVLLTFCMGMVLVLFTGGIAGFMLHNVIPMNNADPNVGTGILGATIVAFMSYWPVLLVSLIGPALFYYAYVQQKKYLEDGAMEELFLAQVKFAVKSAVLMSLAIGLAYFSNFSLTYWSLFLFYFFPWSECWRYLRS